MVSIKKSLKNKVYWFYLQIFLRRGNSIKFIKHITLDYMLFIILLEKMVALVIDKRLPEVIRGCTFYGHTLKLCYI